jgi:quercetin dioxygenase-like cupin family protein
MGDKVFVAELNKATAAEMKPGLLTRRTLAYNDQIMLCHFTLEEGLTLELHKHLAVQVGYVIKGKLRFIKGDGTTFVATAGTSYVFDSNEVHGIDKVYEPTELVECFSPMRPEYVQERVE